MRESSVLLQRLRGGVKVRRYATIDIEATQWVNAYAVGFYDGREYADFIGKNCIGDALDAILIPKYAGLWIYAHNGGNYDFLFFLRRLLDGEMRERYRVDITPIGSGIICFEVHERDQGAHLDGCDGRHCPGCETKRIPKTRVPLKWTFVDSVKLMPLPLSELGETFKIGRKVELKMSYDDLAQPKNRTLMRDYLRQDCVLLYEAVRRMQKVINDLGGQVGITLPSTSLDLWRRRFQNEDVHTNRHFHKCPEFSKEYKKGETPKNGCKNCMHAFVRKAYFGGRSEIFRMRFEPYTDDKGREVKTAKLFDINSHYPSCMLEPMPTSEAIEIEGISEKEVYANARRLTGIVDCDVFIPEDCYLPPLPVIARYDKAGRLRSEDEATSIPGKLIFPVGHFSGTWDTAELCLLKKVGGKILRTRKSVWFVSTTIFARFVRSMFKFRDKRSPTWNAGMDFIAKILLNSLYGKFAMREARKKILIAPSSELLKQDGRESGLKCFDLEADIWTQSVNVSPSYIVPQLSVHVTALARAKLWEILYSIVQNGGRVYYTDTDSVVCAGVDLPVSTELGGLKLEEEVLRGEFVLPKLYLIETAKGNAKKKRESNLKIKAKGMGPGIRVSALGDDDLAGQLSEEEFIGLVKRGVPITRHRLTKLNEGLREMVKNAATFPRIKASPKEMRTRYDKRNVLDDANTSARVLKMF